MKQLTPVQVLTILAKRMEERALVLERVSLPAFEPAVHELRRFAVMLGKAREYVASGVVPPPAG